MPLLNENVAFQLGAEPAERVYLGATKINQGLRPTMNQVVIRGGGWVTGLEVQGTTMYSRTDVGGAYRYDSVQDLWVPIITAESCATDQHYSDWQVEALAAAPSNPEIVYAAVGATGESELNGRLLRSKNGGKAWAATPRSWYVGGNEEGRQGNSRLVVDSTNPNVVYWGTRKNGLLLSVDGGVNWSPLANLPAAANQPMANAYQGVNGIIVDKDSSVVSGRHQTLWAAVGGVGLCRSSDGGTSWSVISAWTTGWIHDMTRASDGNVFFCCYPPSTGASVVRRVNAAGTTVIDISPAEGSGRWMCVVVDPTNPNWVLIGTEGWNNANRVFRSTNAASATPTWAKLDIKVANGGKGTQWPTKADLQFTGTLSPGQLKFRSGVLWFAEGMGMWSTSDLADSEVTWDHHSDGIEELVANDVLKPPGKPLICASWDRGLWRIPDQEGRNPAPGAGASLPHRTTFGSAWDLSISPTDPNFLVAILDDHQDLNGNAYPYRRASAFSTDGGASWITFEALVQGTAPADLLLGNIAVSANDSYNLVWVPSRRTGLNTKIYYTSDRGETWTAGTLTGLTGSEFIHSTYTNDRHILSSHPFLAGVFYALGATTNGHTVLWKTTNKGATWSKQTVTGLDRGQFDHNANTRLRIVPSSDGSSVTFLVNGSNDVWFRSSDGVTWTQKTNLKNTFGFAVGAPMASGEPSAIYTFASNPADKIGLYRSRNLGDTWERLVTYPADIYTHVRGIAGDPLSPGRVYVGIAGVSFVVGQFGGYQNVEPVPPPVPMSDTFPTDIDLSKWAGNTYSTETVAGRLRLASDDTYPQAETEAIFNLAENTKGINVQLFLPTGTADAFTTFTITSPDRSQRAEFVFTDDPIQVIPRLNNVTVPANNVVYNATQHRWLRYILVSGNLVWQMSPDNVTWTTLHSVAAPSWVTGGMVRVLLSSSNIGTAVAGKYAEFDNFNIHP